MLTVFAGEDSAHSRKQYTTFVQSLKEKNYDIRHMSVADVEYIERESAGVTNLFGQEQIYLIENASKKYKGRAKTPYKSALQAISKDTSKHLIDWEDGKSAYELSALKRIATDFRESKLQRTIFQVLDDCYPGNLTQFLRSLNTVLQSQDISFIYAMLCKHMRKLVQAQSEVYEKGSASWQRMKINQQARRWSAKRLKSFYDGLARIDISSKTQSTPYDLRESLEVLVCYYLR